MSCGPCKSIIDFGNFGRHFDCATCSMYARVPQAMATFVLKIEKLSHTMGTTPIIEMRGLCPWLWLLSGAETWLWLLKQLDFMLPCFCSVLYNSPSYSRILISSRLWSISGQMRHWRHHYKKGLRANSPWGQAEWAIGPCPLREKGLIVLVSPN